VKHEDRQTRRLLWAIVVAAAILRAWGLWFGLPHALARPDEREAIEHAIAIAAGDLNPRFFHWPSLQFYVLAFVFRIDALLRPGLPAALGTLPFGHYAMLARGWVALTGVLTVPVAYRLTRRAAGAEAGLAAAAFLAVAPLHVRDSHFAMTDVTMTWLVLCSLWLLVEGATRIEEAGAASLRSSRNFGPWIVLSAGVVGGLATGTKYTAAAILAPAAVAQVSIAVRARPRPSTGVVVPGLAFLGGWAAGVLLSTPYAVLDFARFRADLLFDVSHLAAGHGPDLGPGWIRHLSFSLPYGLGIATFLAAIVGTIVAARRGGLANWLVLTFAGVVYIVTGRGHTVFARYVLPLVPVGCMMAGQAVAALARTRQLPRWALPALVAFIAVPSAVNSAWLDVLLSRPDSRVIAARWIGARLPPGATLYESGREYVQLTIASQDFHRWYYDPATQHFAGARPDMLPEWLILHRSPLGEYTPIPEPIELLARTRYTPIQVIRGTRGDGNPADYDLQDAFFLPLTGFRRVLRPGPTITVYLRRDPGPGRPPGDVEEPLSGAGRRPDR